MKLLKEQAGDIDHEGEDEKGAESSESKDERVPLLFVDVNLGPGRTERIVVYEGEAAEALARKFATQHGKYL